MTSMNSKKKNRCGRIPIFSLCNNKNFEKKTVLMIIFHFNLLSKVYIIDTSLKFKTCSLISIIKNPLDLI